MDIYEFAIEKEKLAREYYLELSGKTTNEGLSHILKMLADEEAKHVDIVQKMKSNEKVDLADSQVLGDAKQVFERMREAKDHFDMNVSQIELYQKAQQIEQQSRDFYMEKAEQAENPAHEKIFNQLADEEKRHYFLLDNIIEFVSKPQTWLENAEWYHLDEY